jgi:hypothetical protein
MARAGEAEHDIGGRQEERSPKAEHRTVGALADQRHAFESVLYPLPARRRLSLVTRVKP